MGRTVPTFVQLIQEAAERWKKFRRALRREDQPHFDRLFVRVREITRIAEVGPDFRRFRPNVVVRLRRPTPFQEDEWLGGTLLFGEEDDAAAIAVTMRDVRCSMVNFDPGSARSAPEVMKAVVRANQNNAGVYGAVTRTGRLAIGQTMFLRTATEKTKNESFSL